MTDALAIDPDVPPSGAGCVECDAAGGWWFHLRRCASCGHIGCCDSSPGRHTTAHWKATGHPLVRSFEPGEEWFWDYGAEELFDSGLELAPPVSRPEGQPAPGPAGRVPADWARSLHS
ncbi:UBP-type zinc finger domain-containing protein [Streptomyces sp. NPDC088254]|uniref:UBP-type zinc finger domain-containing protein n=1 Tax=Streptomyces sp. NPDC088254 TaxID=3365847 RepID=UPI0038061B5A